MFKGLVNLIRKNIDFVNQDNPFSCARTCLKNAGKYLGTDLDVSNIPNSITINDLNQYFQRLDSGLKSEYVESREDNFSEKSVEDLREVYQGKACIIFMDVLGNSSHAKLAYAINKGKVCVFDPYNFNNKKKIELVKTQNFLEKLNPCYMKVFGN
jgi:hypothetical protein